MKLIYIPGACSLAVHIALKAIDVPVELIGFDPATRKLADGRDLSAVTRKPYVPALILPDGEVLSETSAILLSLDELYPKANLLPKDSAKRRAGREWLIYISTELHKTFAPLFSPDLPEAQRLALRERIATRFDFVAGELQKNAFLLGDTFHVSDMYLFVMLLWASVQNISLEHWPSLVAFQARVSERAPVIAAMTAEGLIEANVAAE